MTRRMLPLLVAATTIACGGYKAPTTPTGGDQGNPPPAGAVTVTIQDFSFVPQTVTIKAGTPVHWTNSGPSAHTATSDTGLWDSGSLAAPSGGGGGGYGGGATAGGAFNFTLTQPGTYSYHCTLHPPSLYPNFTGTITVTP
jgi:plastocyanin